jgi:integrase
MRNLRELSAAWIDSRAEAGVAGTTLRSYRTTLNILSRYLGNRPPGELRIQELAGYKRELIGSCAPSTAKVRWDTAVAVVRYGQELGVVPDFRITRDLRRMRGGQPFRRVWQKGEIHRMVDAADPQMRACILLGINLGYGNRDCARLKLTDICGNIVDACRHKTGGERRGWLWPETLAALGRCPPPFVNERGRPLVGDGNDYLRPRFKALLRACRIAADGRGFYSLRRAYRTAVDSHWDRPAIDLTMGHATPGMGARYVAWIEDERLRAVSVHARVRLGFASEGDVVVGGTPTRAC